ncbi:MAG: hypothetical protein QF819_01320 [Gemmatimonadota bacterium]|jgi:hypothetical protein|nr:hypothetical protein [Gemmatimonadota bacterium]MDP6461063.1 hypothetical protein [Gemmatimonadota bacterium]MDP6529542.1 hypothetical protein [Gemmatimonadota bacterium]MDP6801808.1 hypothetical protein [Gemmatimonadota bacterium]MDP7032553.1 hypothetical protein [Gemmatimonadota bacterium]
MPRIFLATCRTLSALLVLGIAVAFLPGCGELDDAASPLAPEAPGGPSLTPPIPVPVGTPIGPFKLKPDLVLSNITFDPGFPMTTSCGGVLPNVGCIGGNRFFTLSVTVTNLGPGFVPANITHIRWGSGSSSGGPWNWDSWNQLIGTAIPPGASVVITRPWYMGPCDCVPSAARPVFFNAIVDPLNTVDETNEGNNGTPTPLAACSDGC